MSTSSVNCIVIRPFQSGDADAFRRLNEEWIKRYYRLEEKDMKTLGHPETIIEAGGQILIAVCGEEPVGCCALLQMGGGTFEVSKMAVTEFHQGKGIGRLLLTTVIEEARRLGAHRLYLETNSDLRPAMNLYESLGFKHLSPEKVTPSLYDRTNVFMELLL